MKPLQRLQSDFQSFLSSGNENILARVTGTAKVSALQRLAIYYDAYRLRLLEALDANYPVLHAWVGDEEFEQLGLAYLDAHPSRHFSIRYFGHLLPVFLGTEVYRDRPYLGEMAALEWALSEVFDAADDELIKIEDIVAIAPASWPTMRFQLHPSLRRLNLRWNVPPIWKAIKQDPANENDASCRGETSSTPSSTQNRRDEDETLKINFPAPTAGEYPQSWLLWRQDLRSYFRSLAVDEAWAIDTAVAGGTFAEICAGMAEWIDEQYVAVHAAGLLKQWVVDGLICKVYF